jgi:hypothetical protein
MGGQAVMRMPFAKVNAMTKNADTSRPEVQELKTLTTVSAAPAR